MRDFGKVYSGFWASETLRDLGDDARFLALYLLTCPHANMAGVFRLPIAYAIEDTGWVSERLRNGFKTLAESGWLAWCEKSGYVWIRNWSKFNKPDNPNQRKAVAKLIDQVPDSVSFKPLMNDFQASSETVSEPLGNLPSPSPSPSPSLGAEIVSVKIPLDDGTECPVPTDLMTELAAAYPRVDLPAEMAKARAWCFSNPANRKTRRGLAKFLTGWVSRADKDAKPAAPVLVGLPGGGRKKLA